MSAVIEVLLDAYGRVAESVPAVLEGLTGEEAAWRPDQEANSIGWLVWHLTRVADSHVAQLAAGDEVHIEQGYLERLGLELPGAATGYGHDPEEAGRVRFADLSVLADYHHAVQEKTAEFLRGTTDLNRIVDRRWDPPVTLGARLVSIVDDMARHVGQAEYVRGLLDRRA